jgi:hypothetical protein
MGMIGIATNGVALFNALDDSHRDAVAHETQDLCDGHPQRRSIYHYHSIPTCIAGTTAKAQQKLVGYALDGFPIFGPRDENGTLLTNAARDARVPVHARLLPRHARLLTAVGWSRTRLTLSAARRRSAQAGETSAERSARQERPSCGARTAGSVRSS